ncbi:MAG: hypothetical protein CMJ81_21395 [Planctomycetaceae bacterium]|nr:hypothetical protein [Planctomycetaceae bacterium]MBP63356.1 hypothetical protein [Planctomycetaceae bacterium]
MAVAALVFLLCLLDLLGGYFSFLAFIAPFRGASLLMDVTFVISGGMLAYLSWGAFRELQ